jgi:protein-tyrosine phosphatase
VTPNLFIGGTLTAMQAEHLLQHGMTAVLDLTAECSESPLFLRPPLHYLNVPMLDLAPPSIEQLDQAARFIRAEIAAGGRVFTHCALGLSRSACVVAAYLLAASEDNGHPSIDDAINRVRAARSGVIFDADTIRRLKEFAAARRAAELIGDLELGMRSTIATAEA